jgi:hypothetical protein
VRGEEGSEKRGTTEMPRKVEAGLIRKYIVVGEVLMRETVN